MHIVLVVYTVNMQDKKNAWHQQENHSPVFVHYGVISSSSVYILTHTVRG